MDTSGRYGDCRDLESGCDLTCLLRLLESGVTPSDADLLWEMVEAGICLSNPPEVSFGDPRVLLHAA